MNVTVRFPDEMMVRLDAVREGKRGLASVGLPSRHATVLLAVSRFLEAEESAAKAAELFVADAGYDALPGKGGYGSINAGLDRFPSSKVGGQ